MHYWTSDSKSFVSYEPRQDTAVLNLYIREEHFAKFKELIQRGANLWPDAPPYIKELADIITNDGTIQQDYVGQDTSPKPSTKEPASD